MLTKKRSEIYVSKISNCCLKNKSSFEVNRFKLVFFFKICLTSHKPKPVFLTVKEIREIMIKGEDMPTAIFSADKQDYIVKPRTIYARKRTKSRIKY